MSVLQKWLTRTQATSGHSQGIVQEITHHLSFVMSCDAFGAA